MHEAEMALFTVARLAAYKYDPKARKTSRLAMGTGFFYRRGKDRLFLITNRHVVYDEERHHFPDKLRLYVHSDKQHLSKIKQIDLKLWDRTKKRLWEHSHSHPAADVITIEINKEAMVGCFFFAFSREDILDDPGSLPGKDINLGLQALVLGYPLDFYDRMNHFPMARMASVATWPWFNFDRKPCFLIDARLHSGMSGSPVISSPGTIHKKSGSPSASISKTNRETYLLGIFSAEWKSHGEPLGLNIVWHASLIEDIIGVE
jgi:hypothetical protein